MADVDDIVQGKTPALPAHQKITIEVIQGSDKGAKFILSRKAKITFGRGGDVDVALNDPMVASHHAAIEIYDDLIVVRDSKSATGVFVNDMQVKTVLVQLGDRIRLGGTIMTISAVPK